MLTLFPARPSSRLPQWITVLAISILLLVIFIIYGTHYFYRDPNSIFYDDERAYERRYSAWREKEGLDFFRVSNSPNNSKFLNLSHSTKVSRGHEPSFCAVIVTFGESRGARRHPLETTIGSLLAGLTIQERKDLDLRVFIANSEPTSHPLYSSNILFMIDQVISARNVASQTLLEQLAYLEHTRSFIEKAAIDFSLALEQCYLNSTAPYVLLFEDDIVAAEGWFVQMQIALREVNALATKRQQDWLDLRLFNDAKEIRWSAYKIKQTNVPMIPFIIAILIFTLSGTLFILCRKLRKTRTGSQRLSIQAMHLICFLIVPSFVILFFKTGHLSTIPRPKGVSVQPWGCCTQGEVFQRSRIPELIAQLRIRAAKNAADITVWDFASESHLLRLVLDPPMVQHLGFSSILAPGRKKKKLVWSVAFEDLDPIDLWKDHQRMVKELYS